MSAEVRWSARSSGWLWIFVAALGQCLGYGSEHQRAAILQPPGQSRLQASFVELRPSQGCSPGYYRANNGLPTGRCVPCNCNGHSNRCQDGSGICINCQHYTVGEHCERCKDGHYGNAIHGSCRVCPCPHTNSFATGCAVTGGNVRCACKPGYTGAQCERCAPGYYGNPQKFGGSCQPCNCNNNGQLGTCDPLTGDCVNQEPKDGSPAEECDDCDSCVMTLLNDLATMVEELRLTKSKLQSLSVSAGVLEQIQHMETQAKDLRNFLPRG